MTDADREHLLRNDANNTRTDDETSPPDDDHRRRITCRCVNGLRWCLTFLCVAAMASAMPQGGLVGVTISTVERRFHLSSWKMSWIRPISKLASLPALLAVGYFGSKISRPAWIAGGLFILAIGCVLYSVPHFVSPPYHYDVSANGTGAIGLCQKIGDAAKQGHCPATEAEDNFKNEAIFAISSILMGVGSGPLFILGPTYIDDATSHSSAAFNIGKCEFR